MEKKILKILIFVVCIIGIISLFLPYVSSKGEYREYLKKNPDVINMPEVGFTNKDVVDISLVENFKLHSFVINNYYSDELYDDALFNIVPIIVITVTIVLIAIIVLLDKKVPIIILDILLVVSLLILNGHITSRGIIPTDNYTYGLTYYLYFAIASVILVSTIYMMFIDKKKKVTE